MANCSRCGVPIPPGAMQCAGCGTPVATGAGYGAAPQPYGMPNGQAGYTPMAGPNMPGSPYGAAPPGPSAASGGYPPAPGPNGYAQPGAHGYAQPGSAGYAQPGAPGYAQPGPTGYGSPGAGGYGGPPRPPAIPLNYGTMVERDPVMVLVFSVLTCGIYQLVWLYRTSEELKNCTNDTTINPGLDLILAIVTCGAWGWFVAFRNTQKVHQALLPLDPTRQDRSQMVLILFLLTLVVGVTGLVALYVAQEEYNALAKATRR